MKYKKDLIVGAVSSNYEVSDVVNWSESIIKSGFKGDVVVFCYNFKATDAIPDFFRNKNFKVVIPHSDMFGNDVEKFQTHTGEGDSTNNYTLVHQQRFFHYWQYLKYGDEMYRYIITTDVRDVVFQTNPSEYLDSFDDGEYTILASSENVLAGNEPWFSGMATKHFGGYVFNDVLSKRPVFNVGTFAARHKVFMDMSINNYYLSLSFHPGVLPAVGDQTGFNLLIATAYSNYTANLGPSSHWGCQCGTMLNPQFAQLQVESIDGIHEKDSIVYNGDTPFVILHQYDRVPDLVEKINEKYSK